MRYLFFMCLSLLVPQLAMSADGPDNHSPVEMREDTDPPDQWRSMPLGDVDPQQRLLLAVTWRGFRNASPLARR